MTRYYSRLPRERPPRHLPDRRRGHRRVRGRAQADRALARVGRPRHDLHAERDRGDQPGRAARTSARATWWSSPRWSTTRTSCRGSCAERAARVRARSTTRAASTSTTSTSCSRRSRSSSPSRTSRTCSARSTRSRRSSRRARAAGALSVIDGAQAVPQIPVDLGAIDADFYAWTGHKAYGPTGIGVLHGRLELLEADAAVPRRRAHDQARWTSTRPPGSSCRGSSRPARRRSPRRSGSAPPSTGSSEIGHGRRARARAARSRRTRWSGCRRSRA